MIFHTIEDYLKLFNCMRITKTETEVSFMVSGCSKFKGRGDFGSLWDTPYMYRGAGYTVGGQPLENIYEIDYSFVKHKCRIQDEIFIYLST